MEAVYFLNIDDLIRYCESNLQQLKKNDGNCKGCPNRKKCKNDRKLCITDGVFRMNETESRFPGLLRILRNNPGLPFAVPGFVYEKAYGRYNSTFPCLFCGREICDHLPEIRRVYDLLTNDASRQTYLNVLMYRLTFQRDYLYRAYSMLPQYLIPPFQNLGSNEVYVDCGAYTGDTFETYCRYNALPRAAYLFEPDPKNIQTMRHALAKYEKQTEIKIIEKGVYHSCGKVYFSGGKGGQSHISDSPVEGSVELDVDTIDNAVDSEISFLKMDIEGSEKAAIMGARQHIESSYPKLAICIYHGVRDMWEIPLMIKQMFPAYNRFELAHHDRSVSETVLYAYRE